MRHHFPTLRPHSSDEMGSLRVSCLQVDFQGIFNEEIWHAWNGICLVITFQYTTVCVYEYTLWFLFCASTVIDESSRLFIFFVFVGMS